MLAAQIQKDSIVKDDWFLEPSFRIGRIVPNYQSADFLWNTFAYGVDFRVGKQTHGKNEWEQWMAYPNYGFVFRYAHFNNPIFKDKIALFLFVSGNIIEISRLSLKYQIGCGVVYFTNPYHYERNPTNLFISTALNAHIDLHLSLDIHISKQADLVLRANFSHSSNGAIRYPNFGINPITGQLALKYHLFPRPERINTIDTIRTFRPKNSFYVGIGPGFRQAKKNYVYKDETSDKYSCTTKYFASTLQIGYTRQFHPNFRYGGGADIMYSSELRTFFPPEKRKEIDCFTVGAFASFEFMYNRVVIHTALAGYVHRKTNFYSWIYERAGFKVLLGSKKAHFIGISIKAHEGMIDYIEWNYGVDFLNWYDKKERILHRKMKKL